jgi:Flp pilus assembly protein TadD
VRELKDDLLEDLGDFDLKSLDRPEAEGSVPAQLLAALARGAVTLRQALGVSDESIHRVAEYAYKLLEHEYSGQAGQIFDGLVTLDPDVAYFHLGLGLALAQQGRRREAFEEFEAAKKLDPQDLTPYVNQVQLLLEEGRKGEALVLFEQARTLDPKELHPLMPALKKLWVTHLEPLPT